MSKVTESSLRMAETLKPLLTVAGDTIAGPDDLFDRTLPEAGLDKETVVKVFRHRDVFVAGANLAAGQLAIETMGKEVELDRLTFETAVVDDKVESTFKRSAQFNAKPGSDEKINIFGVSTFGYTASGEGELKGVAKSLKELGLATLGK